MKPLVAIIMGSDSDLPTMSAAAQVLDDFKVPYELTIVSAHRTPERLFTFAKAAARRGIRVIIAGAGGAAHLPGMVASLSSLPVIGVPIKSTAMDGLDSLLSIAQMPPGVPVATVAVGGAHNAGLLAAQILGANNKSLQHKITQYKKKLKINILKKVKKLKTQGYKKYLSE